MAAGNGSTQTLDSSQKQHVKALRVRRQKHDSWFNSRSRFGGTSDPTIQTQYVRSRARMRREDAEVLYEFNWLAARAVDLIGNDATREWVTLTHKTDPKIADKLREEDRRLNGRGLFEEGIRWGRLHGGDLLVLGAWDGGDPETPLEIERVRNVLFATNVDRYLAYPREWYRDPNNHKYGQPEIYQIHRLSPIGTAGSLPSPTTIPGFPDGGGGGGFTRAQGPGKLFGGPISFVHETRTIRFDGDPLPPVALIRNWGWRASVLDKVFTEIRNFGVGQQAAASILPTFITHKMKIGNLMELIQNDEWDVIRQRIGEIHASMATHNLAFYGNDEELENMGTPIQGLPDLMTKNEDIVSAALGYPKSILFQAESGALGGTAAGIDVRNYYANVGAYQENTLREKVRKWLDVIGVPIGIKPGEVEFEFNSLWQLTAEEESELYLKNSQADQAVINSGMVDTPERLGLHRFSGSVYNSTPPVFDTKRLEAIIKEVDSQPIELGLGDGHGIPSEESLAAEQQQENFETEQANGDNETRNNALDDLIVVDGEAYIRASVVQPVESPNYGANVIGEAVVAPAQNNVPKPLNYAPRKLEMVARRNDKGELVAEITEVLVPGHIDTDESGEGHRHGTAIDDTGTGQTTTTLDGHQPHVHNIMGWKVLSAGDPEHDHEFLPGNQVVGNKKPKQPY